MVMVQVIGSPTRALAGPVTAVAMVIPSAVAFASESLARIVVRGPRPVASSALSVPRTLVQSVVAVTFTAVAGRSVEDIATRAMIVSVWPGVRWMSGLPVTPRPQVSVGSTLLARRGRRRRS